MIVVGLAGPAGSGKSVVARELARRRGVAWLDLDRLAWDTYKPGTSVFAALVARFGSGIVGADGEVDRAALAERAFADPVGKRDLDRLVHPAVTTALADRIEVERRRGRRLLLVEGALLGSSPDVDRSVFDVILWLDASSDVRDERLRVDGRSQHAVRTEKLVQPLGTVAIDADAPLDDVVRRVSLAIAECTSARKKR